MSVKTGGKLILTGSLINRGRNTTLSADLLNEFNCYQLITSRPSKLTQVVKTIKVKECRNDKLESSTVETSSSGSITYSMLSNPLSVHSRLLSVSLSNIRPTKLSEMRLDLIIKLQSVVRRYLVNRVYCVRDVNRKNSLHAMVSDILSAKGKNGFSINLQYHSYRIITKYAYSDLDVMVKMIKNPSSSPLLISNILLILFNCISTNDDHIVEKEFCILVRDILHITFSTSDILSLQNTSELPILPVTFDGLLEWFMTYKAKHPFKKQNKLRMFFDSFSKNDIPVSFIMKLMESRSMFYDLVFNIHKFEQANKQLTCYICGQHFVYPYYYVKHVVICKKLSNNGGDNNIHRKHHHHHRHHKHSKK